MTGLDRRDVSVPDGRLAVWSNDRPGPPLVLLHGGGLDHRMWEPQVTAFAERGDIAFHWVKGHSGHEMNDFVDQLAVAAAARQGAG
jgi:pimeloyl-ACP methyl ester carboxylesterase